MAEIDSILADYTDAAASPGGTRLKDWIARFPEHARELADFAEFHFFCGPGPEDEGSPEGDRDWTETAMRTAARLQAQGKLAIPTDTAAALTSLIGAAGAAGLSQSSFADRLGVGIALAAKLDRRLIQASTIPRALVQEVARAIQRPFDDVVAYLRRGPVVASQASFRAREAPAAYAQSFSEALHSCPGMTDAQRSRWAAEISEPLGEE